MIGRGHREIALFVARPVAEIVFLASRIPAAFFSIDEVETRVRVLIETDVIENEKLRFGAEKRGIARPRCSADIARLS